MIVLTVLAALAFAFIFFGIYQETRLQVKYSELITECENMPEDAKEWREKCDPENRASHKELLFERILSNQSDLREWGRYTSYILLLMLVSGVLRWIWNGRKTGS